MRRKHLTATTLVVAGTLTLGACGGHDMSSMSGTEGSDSSPSSSSDGTADFNDADVTFATDMITHHRQAVEMAELAQTRAESPQVKNLATQIMDAQDPEIETMTGWLTSWGKPVPDDMSGGMDMSSSMPGMMSQDEMTSLENTSGAEFDQTFLAMMLEHHQGAIEMAKSEQSGGLFPDAIALAKQIEAAQTDEITTIQALLR